MYCLSIVAQFSIHLITWKQSHRLSMVNLDGLTRETIVTMGGCPSPSGAASTPAAAQCIRGRCIAWSLQCCNRFFYFHFQMRNYLLNELWSGPPDQTFPLCLWFVASWGTSNWFRPSCLHLWVGPHLICLLDRASHFAFLQKAPGSHTLKLFCGPNASVVWRDGCGVASKSCYCSPRKCWCKILPDMSSYLGFSHTRIPLVQRPPTVLSSCCCCYWHLQEVGRMAGPCFRDPQMSEWEIKFCEDKSGRGGRIRDFWALLILLVWKTARNKSIEKWTTTNTGKHSKVIVIQKPLEAMAVLPLTSKHIWPGTWRCGNI